MNAMRGFLDILSEAPMSDYKPLVPTREDIVHISEEFIPAIERDWGKKADPRLRAVLKHHLTAAMLEMRNKTLEQKKWALKPSIIQ